ncbi:hypothetical protein D1155_10820 [Anaerotruncus sp. 80]|uniref:Uncharacterized protein n=1 Tax=Anaerotruncus colihominis TaxID=169435 RepID=A0A845QN43_9FIRM|nr:MULTISPECIES: hypothetical protein [Clostridia]NBH62143.1 hypothetical protein [Anaerotruncus colihominis]NCE99629.1 hypothetical protein [Emergencia sp. 1XD21-10]NCF02798.1 hypothetical protein [Anaerotruncus sp. 80]
MNRNVAIKIKAMERIETLSKFRRELAESYQKNIDAEENAILSESYSKLENAVQTVFDAEIKYLSKI